MRGLSSPYKNPTKPCYNYEEYKAKNNFDRSKLRDETTRQAMTYFYKKRKHTTPKLSKMSKSAELMKEFEDEMKNSSFYDYLAGVFHPEKRAPVVVFIIGLAIFLSSYFSSAYGRFILFGIYPFGQNDGSFNDTTSNKLKRMGLVLGGILIIFGALWFFFFDGRSEKFRNTDGSKKVIDTIEAKEPLKIAKSYSIIRKTLPGIENISELTGILGG